MNLNRIVYSVSCLVTVCVILGLAFHSCQEEVIYSGDITGVITERNNTIPVPGARVVIQKPIISTTYTDSSGNYQFLNIKPGTYEINISKIGYEDLSKILTVESAVFSSFDFGLVPTGILDISTNRLDYGYDKSSLQITLSNSGKVNLGFFAIPTTSWIETDPSSGTVEPGGELMLSVDVNREELLKSSDSDNFKITHANGDTIISIYVKRGVQDIEGRWYPIVTIGDQVWMAEDLAVTRDPDSIPIEWWYYDDSQQYKNFGRLYLWETAMNGKTMERTQGICPDGWHIPDSVEWQELVDNYQEGEETYYLLQKGSSVFNAMRSGWGLKYTSFGLSDTIVFEYFGSGVDWFTSTPNSINGHGLVVGFCNTVMNWNPIADQIYWMPEHEIDRPGTEANTYYIDHVRCIQDTHKKK